MNLQDTLIVSVMITASDLASSVVTKLGASLATLGPIGMAAVGVGAAVGAIGAISIGAAEQFNQAMARIGALTDTSQAQMQAYTNAIMQMAPAIDQSPKALADGLYFVISAGYKGADALNILKLAAEASAASMTPMKDVTDLLTTAMNAYRIQSLSAGEAMDDITKIVVNGKVTMQSLATSFGFVAVTAANSGLKFNEAASAVSALSQIAGAHGARRVMMDLDNALRNLGPKMEDLSAKAEKMKNLKEPWDAAAFAAMNFGDKLQYIASETGGIGYLDKTQAAAYMATGNFKNLAQATAHANKNFMDLVGGAAAFLPMAMLLGDKMSSYNTILGQMDKNTADFGKSTQEAFDVMRGSTAQKWKMFQTTIETIFTMLGLQLLPAVNKVLDGLRAAGMAIVGWLAMPGIFDKIKYACIGLGMILLYFLLPGMLSFAAATVTALAPVFAVIAASIALGAAIEWLVNKLGGWDAIMARLQPAIAKVKEVVGELWQRIQPLLALAWDNIKAAGEALRTAFADPSVQAALDQLKQVLPYIAMALGVLIGLPIVAAVGAIVAIIVAFGFAVRILSTVLGVVIRVVADVILAITRIPDALGAAGEAIGAFAGAVGGFFGGVLGAIGGFFGGVLGTIGGFFGGVLGAIGSFGTRFAAAFLHVLQTVLYFVVGLGVILYRSNPVFHLLVSVVVGAFHVITQAVPRFIGQIAADVARGWSIVVAHTQQAWNGVVARTQQAWGFVQQHIVTPVRAAAATVMATLAAVASWLATLWNSVVAKVQQAWSIFTQAVTGALAPIVAAAGNIVTQIQNLINGLVTAALDWGKNIITNFVKGITDNLGAVGNAFQSIVNVGASFLQGHSPPPKWPELANAGPNVIRVFSAGILAELPTLSTALGKVIGTANAALGGGSPGRPALGSLAGAAGGAGGGLGGVVAAAGSGSASGPVTHNWNLSFPGVKDKEQIKQAVLELQQEQYREARRPGAYGGLRAGPA